MFFDSWAGILRVIVVGLGAYAALILVLRVAGKRTLAKMNAFDFVVTVALGSTLATILLSDRVALAEGVTAFVLLAVAQVVIAWLSVRSAWLRRLVKAEPRLLFHRGAMLHAAMRSERVTEDEVLAAVRSAGHGGLDAVAAVVLETDGTFSVLSRVSGDVAALAAVSGADVRNGARRVS